MKIKTKLISIFITILVLIVSFPICSRAAIDDIISEADGFLTSGDTSTVITPDESQLKNISNIVSGVLLTIAVGITFISLAIMGFNFAVQSVEDKAKIKESMIPWVIGVFVSFGAYGIWKFVMSIFYKL